jgi:hypothetical protein
MKRISILLFFLYLFQGLFAQPSIDTVRPGIKSMTNLICGYSIKKHRDSTGLLVYTEKEYDRSGKKIMEIQMRDPDDAEDGEEPSFYGNHDSKEENICDTTFYKYNEKGLLIMEYGNYLNKPWKEIYSYDDSNRYILEEYFSDGNLSFYDKVRYDSNGKLVNSYYKSVDPDFKGTIERNYFYDSLGREKLNVMYEDSIYHDSTFHYYSPTGKTEIEKSKSGIYQRRVYDLNDHIIYHVYVDSSKNSSGHLVQNVRDSASRSYDINGNLIWSCNYGNYYPHGSCEFNQYDQKNRLLTSVGVEGKDTTSKSVYLYNDKLHTEDYQQFEDGKFSFHRINYYDSDGEMIGILDLNKKGKLITRYVYVYTSY